MSKPNPHKQYSQSTYSPGKRSIAKRGGHVARQETKPQSHGACKETLALPGEVRYELASHLYVRWATEGDEHQGHDSRIALAAAVVHRIDRPALRPRHRTARSRGEGLRGQRSRGVLPVRATVQDLRCRTASAARRWRDAAGGRSHLRAGAVV